MNEENKTWKKIDETRKKATDIMQARKRNKTALEQKQALKEKWMQDEEEKKNFNKMIKQDLQQQVNMAKQEYYDKVRNEVNQRRQEMND